MRLVQWFNKGLCTVASPGEVLGAAVVLGIVFIFIVPLPTWLVDVLIALNICIASLLIVLAFYLPSRSAVRCRLWLPRPVRFFSGLPC